MASREEILREIEIISEDIQSLEDELVYLEREAGQDRQLENPGTLNEDSFLIGSDRENANIDDFEKDLYESNRKIKEIKRETESLSSKRQDYESLLNEE